MVDVTGPDGVGVRLYVRRSGFVGLGSSDGWEMLGFTLLPSIIVSGLSWIAHKLFFGGGFTVHATVIGGHSAKFREPSEEAAMRRLHLLATAIELSGTSALK